MKALTSIFLSFLLMISTTFASSNPSSLFELNSSEISSSMAHLSLLETYINNHSSINIEYIAKQYPALFSEFIIPNFSPYVASNILINQQLNGNDGCTTVIVVSCCIFLGISLGYYLVAKV